MKDVKYEDLLCSKCPYTQCFMNGRTDRTEECDWEKELRLKKEKHRELDVKMRELEELIIRDRFEEDKIHLHINKFKQYIKRCWG